ncbi:MAG: hypothetical protein Q9159_007269 [Coniocarpon cinnabarinum]
MKAILAITTGLLATVTSALPSRISAPAPSVEQPHQPAPVERAIQADPGKPGSAQWQKTIVDQHNLHRKNHGVSPLAWSTGLAKAAQMVADKSTGLSVSGYAQYGQNIGTYAGTDNVINDITGWYNEVTVFNRDNSWYVPTPSDIAETGHFSQIVWAATTHVGCALGNCPKGVQSGLDVFLVCDYGPAGNVPGQWDKNVFPPAVFPPPS